MTELRLAAVNGEQTIGVGPGSAIAAQAQGFADAIAEGRLELTTAVIVTLDENGCIDFACIGDPVRVDQGIGMLELAKARLVAGCWR